MIWWGDNSEEDLGEHDWDESPRGWIVWLIQAAIVCLAGYAIGRYWGDW